MSEAPVTLALALAFVSFLGGFSARAADAPPPAPVELWVLDPQRLSAAEKTLAATLQGVLNEERATVWLRTRGMSAVVLEELKGEGAVLHEVTSPWEIVAHFRDRIAGAIVYEPGTESLNVATSLCGPRHAVAVDAGLANRAEQEGLKVLEDVRGVSEAEALKRYQASFARGIVVHQPPGKSMHLRDYAVTRHAFTFATEDPARRSATLRRWGPCRWCSAGARMNAGWSRRSRRPAGW